MRVGIVCPYSWDIPGGVQAHVRDLAEKLDMQAMYDLVGDRIREIFDAQAVDIGVLVPETGMIHFPYSITKGVRDPVETTEPSGLSTYVMQSRQPLLINERLMDRLTDIGGTAVASSSPFSRPTSSPTTAVWHPASSYATARASPSGYRNQYTWCGPSSRWQACSLGAWGSPFTSSTSCSTPVVSSSAGAWIGGPRGSPV